MKRLISLAAGLAAFLGLAAPALAIHAEIPAETSAIVAKGTTQITISGDLRVRGWLKKNIAGNGAIVDGQNQTYYDERVRLAVDASAGSVSGRIHLESNSGYADSFKWGTPPNIGPANNPVGTDFNAKPTAMGILEAWIQYNGTGLFGMPAGIKAGHMPLALGPETLFFDNTHFGDDAIVGWLDPTPQTHITAVAIKAAEGDAGVTGPSNSSDLDVYVAALNQVLAAQNLQAYYVYANGPEAATKINVPANGNIQFGPNIKLQDLGLNAAGKFSGLSYAFEYDQQFGSALVGGTNLTTNRGTKGDFKGYALELDLGYNFGPANVRLAGVYGSGPKANSNNVDAFVNFRMDDPYHTVVYGYQAANAMGQVNGQGVFGQWSNTEMLNLGVDLNPVADLKVALDAYLLKATETSAFAAALGHGVSSNIGTEYDMVANYALTKNLNYFVKAGALVAGNFYNDTAGLAGFNSGAKKTAVVAMHGLEFAF